MEKNKNPKTVYEFSNLKKKKYIQSLLIRSIPFIIKLKQPDIPALFWNPIPLICYYAVIL